MTFPDSLILLNQEARYRFGMVLKESAAIEAEHVEHLGSKDWSPRGEIPGLMSACILDRVIMCGPKEAVAFVGLSVDADPEIRISVRIDGEEVLAKAPPGDTPGKDLSASRDLFLAERAQGDKVGLFLPNGTHIVVFADAPIKAGLKLSLKTATYVLTHQIFDQ